MPKLKNPSIMVACERHGLTRHFTRADGGYPRCRKCHSEGFVLRRQRQKEQLVREAGGKCVLCGYDRYLGALHFHHRDPKAKAFNVSARNVGLARLREETEKCVLLCARCHMEVEGGVAVLPDGFE